NNTLIIRNAGTVRLLIAAQTSYKANDFPQRITRQLDLAAKHSTHNLKQRHIADHQQLFQRVSFDLGTTDRDQLPTDKRVADAKKGTKDPTLAAVLFQYGRYLLIGSSRP